MLKKNLVVLLITFSLAGCNMETIDNRKESSSAGLYSITPLSDGFPTFAASNITTRSISRNSGNPGYVYQSLSGATIDVEFLGRPNGNSDTSVLTPPQILNIRDINQKYSAINMADVNLLIGETEYTGNYTVIFDKDSGTLHPLLDDGEPIYYQVDAEHEFWYTKTRFSNIADEDRLYFRHTDSKSLHVAELVDGSFHINKVFDDYFGAFVVDASGTILRKNWSGGEYIWVDPTTLEQTRLTSTINATPILINGELHGNDNGTIYAFSKSESRLTSTVSEWSSTKYRTDSFSVKRGDYEMTRNCAVYYFNQTTKTISEIHPAEQTGDGRSAAAAGKDSLFCLYGGETDDSLPKFKVFDITDQTITTFDTKSGTNLNAGERLTVVSDKELMFYEYPSGTFTEYYIKTNGAEHQKINSTGNVSVVLHLNKGN